MTETKSYDSASRRSTYLRWRLREGKKVSEQERRELNAHDAKKVGVSADALDELTFTEPALLQRKRAAELHELASEAGLVAADEKKTKAELIEVIKTFQQLGLRAASHAL